MNVWTPVSIWLGEAAWVAGLLALLTVPGWCAIDLLRSRRALDSVPDPAALLSVPATIVLIGLLFLPLQVSGVGTWAFTAAAAALFGLSSVWLVIGKARRARAVNDLVRYRWCLLVPALAAVCAICYLGVGLDRFGAMTDWTRAAYRNLHDLPQDNELSWLASETWRRHLRPNTLFFSIWRISDRGPLYGLIHVFLGRAFEPDAATYANYTRLGIVLNSLFLIPLVLWLSSVLRPRPARVAALLVALNPWFFLNIYYTWPKLFAASFMVAAAHLLWRRPAPASATAFAISGVLAGLSVLAHSGVAVTLPVFWAVTTVGFVRSWRGLLNSLLMPLMVVLVMWPWQHYKDRRAPDTYNLFYMHYLDGKEYFSPFGHNVGRFFAEHPAAEQLAVRSHNVTDLLWGQIDTRLLARFWRGDDVGAALYPKEFFTPWHSAGLLWFAIAAVAVPFRFAMKWTPLARSALISRLLRPLDVPPRVSVTAVVCFAVLGLTINTAVRWSPPHSHELPYMEVVMLAACMLVALARLGRLWFVLAALAILWRQVFYFTESARVSNLRLPAMDTFGVLFWATVAGALLVAAWADRRAGAPDDPLPS